MQVELTQDRRFATRSLRDKSFRRRVGIAMVAGVLVASGAASSAIAKVRSGDRHVFGSPSSTGIRVSENEKFLAAAPVIALTLHQSASAAAYEPVLVTMGMARHKMLTSSDITQSASNPLEYYYSGSALSANTMYNHRASQEKRKMREGTLGSLPTYGMAFGDNDSLGADTLYFRPGGIVLSGMSNSAYNGFYDEPEYEGSFNGSNVFTQGGSSRIYFRVNGSDYDVVYWNTDTAQWEVQTFDTTTHPGAFVDATTYTSAAAAEAITASSELYDTSYARPAASDPNVSYDLTSNYILYFWDESVTNGTIDAGTTVECWFDQTDSATASALTGWEAPYRYVTDWRDGTTQIDLAGTAPGSSGSSMRGWQWIGCLPPGTFKQNWQATNNAGDAAIATQTITVSASGRATVKTVQASGGDYTTLAAALSAATGNAGWKIEVEDGHAETITTIAAINHPRLWIEFQGACTLTKAVGVPRIFSVREDWVTIKGATMTSADAITSEAVELLANGRCALVDCHLDGGSLSANFNRFVSVKHFNQASPIYGLLMQGCSADIYNTYLISGSINRAGICDVVVIGCDLWGDEGVSATEIVSIDESGMRDVVRTMSQTIAYSRVRELEKDVVRWMDMEYGYAYRNRFDGAFRVGASSGPVNKARHCRIEENYWTRANTASGLGCVALKEGIDGLYVVNNIFVIDVAVNAIGGSGDPGDEPSYFRGYQGHTGIVFAHNTIVLTATDATLLIGSGALVSTYVSGMVFYNNQVLYHEAYTGTAILDNAATSTNNDVAAGSIDEDLIPSVTPNTTSVYGGVLYDYHGNLREATTLRGAFASMGESPPVSTPTRGRGRARDRGRIALRG